MSARLRTSLYGPSSAAIGTRGFSPLRRPASVFAVSCGYVETISVMRSFELVSSQYGPGLQLLLK